MKKYTIVFLLFCYIQARSKEESTRLFVSPLDFPLYLSANFGELRSNHFHGGLDFKTQNVTGKAVRCIADGYISRVTVSAGGFGKVMYVTHNNGYTSLYGHIMGFNPDVSNYVEKYQYEHETFEADIQFDASQFPVKQGNIIALSGNEGFSFGPHLHLEIRKTESGERINPLFFYKDKITDRIPPQAKAITLYPQLGKGIVNSTIFKQSFPVLAHTPSQCVQKPIEAWGEIGLGITAFDYMNGTANNYGIHSITLFLDSQEVFNSTVNSFLAHENRTLNSYTDFSEYRRKNSWIMKSFIAPGNRFRGLSGKNNGIIRIDQERKYKVKYVLSDFYGNVAVYEFSIIGKPQHIPPYKPNATHYLFWDKPNIVQEPGMELILPKGILYENIALNCNVSNDSNSISFEYRLHDEEYPLHTYCDLMIGIRNMPIKDMSKYYVIRKSGKLKQYMGGKYENGWIKASIRELGTYAVAIDTIAPKMTPIGKASWSKTGTINYTISDGQTGIKEYKGIIDGKFALFIFNARTARLTCKLDARRISKGKQHELELTVTDNCGNKRIIKELFNW